MKNIEKIIISDIEVEVERKPIKNMHLSVYPPDARVHLSMPDYLTDEDARAFILQKWDWVLRKREEVLLQPRQTDRQYVSGESHYLFGRRYQLIVEELPDCLNMIELRGNKMYMFIKPGLTLLERHKVMGAYYKAQLQKELKPMIDRWAEKLGETGYEWNIQQMKTEWGSCVKSKRKLLFNVELARVPTECIDFVIVHEFTHFIIDNHNKFFEALMTKRLPGWRSLRTKLNNFIALPYKD